MRRPEEELERPCSGYGCGGPSHNQRLRLGDGEYETCLRGRRRFWATATGRRPPYSASYSDDSESDPWQPRPCSRVSTKHRLAVERWRCETSAQCAPASPERLRPLTRGMRVLLARKLRASGQMNEACSRWCQPVLSRAQVVLCNRLEASSRLRFCLLGQRPECKIKEGGRGGCDAREGIAVPRIMRLSLRSSWRALSGKKCLALSEEEEA